jgi:hypothetical protein
VSIPVQCPNPACGKTHRVKNRWAGKRGTCPDCGTVIEVPGVPLAQPVASAPSHSAASAQEMRPLSADITAAAEPGAVAQGEETLIAESAITEEPFLAEEVPDEDAAPVRPAPVPGRYFSVSTAVLYLLGILGLGAVAAAPFLPVRGISIDPPPSQFNSGLKQTALSPYLLAVPAAAAAIALVGYLAALFARHFGLAMLLTAYPAVLLAGVCLAFWGLLARVIHADNVAATTHSAADFGRSAEVAFGPGAWAGLGGAAAATFFLAIAILLTHRHLWAKLVFAVLALLGLGLGGALVFLADKA